MSNDFWSKPKDLPKKPSKPVFQDLDEADYEPRQKTKEEKKVKTRIPEYIREDGLEIVDAYLKQYQNKSELRVKLALRFKSWLEQ